MYQILNYINYNDFNLKYVSSHQFIFYLIVGRPTTGIVDLNTLNGSLLGVNIALQTTYSNSCSFLVCSVI